MIKKKVYKDFAINNKFDKFSEDSKNNSNSNSPNLSKFQDKNSFI